MIIASITCRDCESGVATFASEYEPVFQAIIETQAHFDLMFKARCQNCYACNWEVVGVVENPNGVQALSMLPGEPSYNRPERAENPAP